MSTTRSDSLPAKRDEVAALLRRLADLVEHDRWEDAAKLHAVMQDGFTTCFTAWNALRFKRNLVKREAALASFNYPEAIVAHRDAYQAVGEAVSMVGRAISSYGFRADPRSIAP